MPPEPNSRFWSNIAYWTTWISTIQKKKSQLKSYKLEIEKVNSLNLMRSEVLWKEIAEIQPLYGGAGCGWYLSGNNEVAFQWECMLKSIQAWLFLFKPVTLLPDSSPVPQYRVWERARGGELMDCRGWNEPNFSSLYVFCGNVDLVHWNW